MDAAALGTQANRLFDGFLAPLVLGGELRPGRPFGARAALAMGRERVVADSDLYARVQTARTRVARRLAPVDELPAPTEAEWALAATLHDLLQAAHPGFHAAFRRSGPTKVLNLVEGALGRIPPPSTLGEVLSRHSVFSRMFEITRTDTVVRWWVGSREFLGETPPPRLSAWPELRRVHIETTPRAIMDLPGAGGAVDAARFGELLSVFLTKTPLTDLASCARGSPQFLWTAETLGFLATGPGEVLASRALASLPAAGAAIDAALGAATRALLATPLAPLSGPALELLGERASAWALSVAGRGDRPPPPRDTSAPEGYARVLGALVATARLSDARVPYGEADRARMLAVLSAIATSTAGRALAAEIGKAPALARYFFANAAGSVGGSSVSIEP